jgi:hypothetical protein
MQEKLSILGCRASGTQSLSLNIYNLLRRGRIISRVESWIDRGLVKDLLAPWPTTSCHAIDHRERYESA